MNSYGTAMSDRYVVHSNGTVTDTQTGLMWEYEPPEERRTWEKAQEYCAALAGNADWRLPTIGELFTLVDYTRTNPACALPTAASTYWSATTYANFPLYAWYVYFNFGVVNVSLKGSNNYVRAVRAASSRSFDSSTLGPLSEREQAVIRAMRGVNA